MAPYERGKQDAVCGLPRGGTSDHLDLAMTTVEAFRRVFRDRIAKYDRGYDLGLKQRSKLRGGRQ